jgi:hypothetical protein
MNIRQLREHIRKIIKEGTYDSKSSEAKNAISAIRDKGYDEIADVISRAWSLHDKLGVELYKNSGNRPGNERMDDASGTISTTEMFRGDINDAFKVADQLVKLCDRTLKPKLQQKDLLTDYIEEEISSAKSALDIAENPKDMSLLVQRPIHNAIEGAVEKILDKSLN